MYMYITEITPTLNFKTAKLLLYLKFFCLERAEHKHDDTIHLVGLWGINIRREGGSKGGLECRMTSNLSNGGRLMGNNSTQKQELTGGTIKKKKST